jgi:hypothetical protein
MPATTPGAVPEPLPVSLPRITATLMVSKNIPSLPLSSTLNNNLKASLKPSFCDQIPNIKDLMI